MSVNRPGRRLVQRSQRPDESPAPLHSNRRPRASETPFYGEREPLALPPYEPPTCPLSEDAKRKIETLHSDRNYAGYKKHIEMAMENVKKAAMESNDRLANRQDKVEKNTARRQAKGIDDDEKPDDHKAAEFYLKNFEKKVEPISMETEKALRDLIDYRDELDSQEAILKDVTNRIPIAPAPRRPRVAGDENEDGDEEDPEPVDEGERVSALEALRQAKENYKTRYASKSMKSRYADNNEYKYFKTVVYDAQHQGTDAPPLPHAKFWFNEETKEPNHTRRTANATDNDNNGSDSDDEVFIAKASVIIKCPITLTYFNEPYSSNLCNHVFERYAIEDLLNTSGAFFPTRGRNGENIQGEKKVKCPQMGCEKMIALSNLHLDELVLRQVKRAKERMQKESGDGSSDDEDEDQGPSGTQRKPQNLDGDDDGVDIDEQDNMRKRKVLKVKKERTSRAPSRRPELVDEDVTMLDDDNK